MRRRPWNPFGRDDSFYMDAVYVVVDAVTVNDDDVPAARLLISLWPRMCNRGHLHFPGEPITVFAQSAALAVFLAQVIPATRLREGAVFYAARLGFVPREGEMLRNLSAHFMRPLLDASDVARNMAAEAMLSAIRRSDAASCDWNE